MCVKRRKKVRRDTIPLRVDFPIITDLLERASWNGAGPLPAGYGGRLSRDREGAGCPFSAAAGAMAIHGCLTTLFADSTMPGFRGAGDLATASTLPGSVSQRNYERNGFRVAYTKAI